MIFCCILAVAVLHCAVFTLAKPMSEVYMDDNDVLNEEMFDDPEIEEISKREYETVHDRILAVNMAHFEKRKLSTQKKNDTNDTSVFDKIELNDERLPDHLYQGDIQMDEELEEILHMPNRTRTKRNALGSRKKLWTSRIIPYLIPGYMSHIRQNFMGVIADFHKNTCIRFVPYQPGRHKNYITFYRGDGCSSKIGKKYHKPGAQRISLGQGCNALSIIKHEVLHAVGFFHEQARADRDKFVKIYWQNIKPGHADQFDKYTWKTIDNLGQLYDYDSIMHYGRKAFTKNTKFTIVAIDNPNKVFGTTDMLSTGDIIEINALYDCKVKRYGWTRWSEFTPCSESCYKKRERFCYHPGNVKYCGGNANMFGIEKQDVKCTKMECFARNSVSGNWGHWSHWSACSVQCDDGARTRTRQCNDPKPSKYGRKCVGNSKEEGVCSVRRCNPGPEDTDFDDPNRPLGIWHNKPGADIKWTRHRGFTQTMNTGPMHDHTTGKGYYLYMESSGKEAKGKQAKLISKKLTLKPGGQCLKFYYMMNGKTMGSLEVRLNQYGRKKSTLFYKKGDQKQIWKLATATLKNLNGQFEIEFIATVGARGYSDIAIDDVYFDDGECSCQDKLVSCEKWSRQGECYKNKNWMAERCPRTCRICAGLQGPAPKAPIAGLANIGKPQQPKPMICEDKNKVQCPLWAKKDECSKSKDYMHKHCPKSCKICKVPKCEDSNKAQCPLWAKKGECDRNKKFMNNNCPKSCKICKGETCEDNIEYKSKCALWAGKGECRKNKQFMELNCRKTCNACSCGNTDPKCDTWTRKGECQKNPDYMELHCKKACGKC